MKMFRYILPILLLLHAVTITAQPARGVCPEDIEHVPAADVTGVLQGKIAGLDVSSMLVHGRSPLVIVDGVERSLSELGAMEIESVYLLTDAVSAALYGVRGGNGVLLVTTRRGGGSGLNISAQYAYGLSTQFRRPVFADAFTYVTAVNSALASDGLPPRYSNTYPDVDWWKETVKDAGHSHNLRLAFDGGGSSFRHHTSVEYLSERSMLDERDTGLSVRTDMDAGLSPSTFLAADISARLNEFLGPFHSGEYIMKMVYDTPSAEFPIREDEEYNPVAYLKDKGHMRKMYASLLADMTLRQDLDVITDGLRAQVQVHFDNTGGMKEAAAKTDSPDIEHTQSFESLVMRAGLKAELLYQRTFGRHEVDASAIYDMRSVVSDGRNNTRRNLSSALAASYSYDGRYSISAVLSHSGSAFLPPGARFHTYPAVSAAWTLSNEKFMAGAGWLDMLRLSASYGLSGYDGNLSHELWRVSYGAGGGYVFGDNANGYAGASEGPLPVVGLVPEKTERISLALDLAAFRNRLNLALEGFRDYRSDVLVPGSSSISGIIGADVAKVCEGEYLYRGFDLTLDWSDKVGDFSYGAGFRLSCMDTEVINENQPYQEYDYLYHAGNRIGQCYGLEAEGFFAGQQEIDASPVQKFSDVRPGDVKYKDQNGDNVIDSRDVVKMHGSVIPHCSFGFDITLGYRGFELHADFQGVSAVTVNLLDSPLYHPLMDNGNISQTFLDNEIPWTYDNRDVATVPRLTTLPNANNMQPSSLWFRNGSYLKLRNIVLSYTFGRSMIGFADMKVFVQGSDLFSVDRIGFADPQRLGDVYPSVRTWWAGVRFDF